MSSAVRKVTVTFPRLQEYHFCGLPHGFLSIIAAGSSKAPPKRIAKVEG